MREITGNLWEVKCAARCITTNGETLSDNVTAVMGRGVALQAKERYPWLPKRLGKLLRAHGNHVYDLGRWDKVRIITFPTKRRWRAPSELRLIRESCRELRSLILPETGLVAGMPRPKDFPKLVGDIVLPRPGCGHGNLNYAAVRPILLEELPEDNFVVVTPP
jgi:hypothetical protein